MVKSTGTGSRFGLREIRCIGPDDDAHVTGTVLDSSIGVSGGVLEKVVNSIKGGTSGDALTKGELGQCWEHSGIDSAGKVEENTDDFTNKSSFALRDGWGSVAGSVLDRLPIEDGVELSGAVGWLGGRDDIEATKGSGNVARHAEGDSALDLVIGEGHANVFGGLFVDIKLVLFADGAEEVFKCFAVLPFDEEVVDDKGE